MKTFTTTIIAAAFALGVCAAVEAAPAEAPTERVSYVDLDLSRAAGRAVLEQRIRHAIRRVCPPRPSPPDPINMKIFRACHAQAWAGVQPQLAMIYRGRQLAQSTIEVRAAAL